MLYTYSLLRNAPRWHGKFISSEFKTCYIRLTFGGGETVFAQTCNKLIPGRGRVSKRFNISEERILGPRLLTGSCRTEKKET